MNRTLQRGLRYRLPAVAAATALALGGLAFGPAASAHDGAHPEPAADEPALDWSNYERILLTKDVGEPIDLAVIPGEDGDVVLHTARNGDVRLTDPQTGVTKVVNTLSVYRNSEDGLQGIAVDPDFAENKWVYLVYAPLDADGDGNPDVPSGNAPNSLPAGADESYWDQWKGVNRLSRFQWTGESLDLSTEQVILDIEVQRGQCCHVGADMDWDADGNLYLSTGDNTPASTPGANGFAPNNDAPGMNPGFDSRRGAGNTNDLRGKILRIHVEEDGSYTIPEGNLFAPGTEGTRPEIFVMGVRNPFRIDVDPETNSLSWGDYGPDATRAQAEAAERGPMGFVEWNVVSLDEPHNAGWPYVHANNQAYADWDFATGTSNGYFDPENLVNDSRWNTGLTNLPPARSATVWYGDEPGDQPWDELVNFGSGRGQGPMGGPVYHYDESNPSTTKLPAYWDNKAFFGEFSQDYVAAFTVDWDAYEVTHIEDFLPNKALFQAAQPQHDNPMDLEFGSDGSLYVLDYGDGFFRQNPDSGLYRIDYAEGNKSPQASFTTTPESSSSAPLEVAFDASASRDPDGDALTYEWDFDGDGTFDATGVTVSHTYDQLGAYTARLRVKDGSGKVGLTTRQISVGNQAPEVTIEFPENGGFFQWGDKVPFRVTTNDAEDGTATVCDRVLWTYGLGHDEHAHPEASGKGCEGTLPTDPNSPEHGAGALLYGAVVVSYTDGGANGLPPAKGEASIRLNPKTQEAEHAIERVGTENYADETASGGNAVRGLGEGDHLMYRTVSFAGIDGAVIRAAGEGEVQLRWGAADAEPFATATIPAGAGWQDVEIAFDAPEGTGQLFVTSRNDLALDSLTMVGAGVLAPVPTVETTTEATVAAEAEYGAPGAVDIAVTGEGGTPTGEAVVRVDGTEIGRAALDAAGKAQVALPADLAIGTHEITVSYRGDGTFKRSTDTAELVIVPASSSVAVETSAAKPGKAATATVTVTTGTGVVPAGDVKVTVLRGGKAFKSVGGTLDANGAVVVTLPKLGAGSYELLVEYGGSDTVKASSTTAGLNVRP